MSSPSGVEPAALLELGAALVALALLARAAAGAGLSPVPLYLVAGIVLGQFGDEPLSLPPGTVETAAEIGVVLLLFTLGLEYTSGELADTLRDGTKPAALDALLGAAPGAVAALLLGWPAEGVALLAGITYISSSGIVAKLLDDLGRLGNRETPTVLGILVMEDLAMALYLPVLAVLLAGAGAVEGAGLLAVALGAGAAAIYIVLRHADAVSRLLTATSSEVVLLSALGFALLCAGAAALAQLSAAVGAFLAGIVVSGPVAGRARALVTPLRDLFAAAFFVLFGISIELGGLGAVALPALLLAVATAAAKLATGWWAARRNGVGPRGRARAGTVLIARGEFSIVIAGLGVSAGIAEDVAPLAALYVLLTILIASLAARWADPLGDWLGALRPRRASSGRRDAAPPA